MTLNLLLLGLLLILLPTGYLAYFRLSARRVGTVGRVLSAASCSGAVAIFVICFIRLIV